MTVILDGFKRRHLDGFKPGEFDQEVNGERFQEWALQQTGNGLTAIIDGKVAGFLFITVPVDGISIAQVFGSDEARKKHWLWVGMAFRRGIEIVPRNMGIRKLRTDVMDGFEQSHKWLGRLGFYPISYEGGFVTYERNCEWQS